MRNRLILFGWLFIILGVHSAHMNVIRAQTPNAHNIVGQAPVLTDAVDSTKIKNGTVSGADLISPFRYNGTYFYAVQGVYSGTVQAAGVINTGKYYGLTACSAWSDTTGWTGPRLFIFAAADTIYLYTAAHTIKKFPGI